MVRAPAGRPVIMRDTRKKDPGWERNGATTRAIGTLITKRWIQQNRTVLILNSFALFCLAIGWILYALFGHRLIEAMYKGEAVDFLSSIIEGKTFIRYHITFKTQTT